MTAMGLELQQAAARLSGTPRPQRHNAPAARPATQCRAACRVAAAPLRATALPSLKQRPATSRRRHSVAAAVAGEATVAGDVAVVAAAETIPSAAPVEIISASLSGSESSDEDTPYYSPQLELLSAAKVVPHPAKVEKGGEDAYLISDVGAGVLCVADGVGGWANDGVDPALYSRELVGHVGDAVEMAECQEDLDPLALLRYAHGATGAEGASTAVVAVLDGERSVLQVANLGDSGAMVVRRGEVVFRSASQQHFFDCPFQLGSESSDSADSADVYSWEVQEGDVVVLASDGLFDNVFEKDIACVIKVFGGRDRLATQRCATALCALASKHAADAEYMSPYILEAVEQGQDLPVWEKMMGKKLSGGKLDDITVVVATVVKATPPPEEEVEKQEQQQEQQQQEKHAAVGEAQGPAAPGA